MRGANPLACKICLPQIRSVFPHMLLSRLNAPPAGGFTIESSAGNATAPNQSFVRVTGAGVHDEYSARDRPTGFRPYPQSYAGTLSVSDFINVF